MGMKKLLLFVLGLLLFFSPLAVQAEEFEIMPQEEISEAPALEPITEKQLNDLFGEDVATSFQLKGITATKRKKDSFRRGSKYTNWRTLRVRLFSV